MKLIPARIVITALFAGLTGTMTWVLFNTHAPISEPGQALPHHTTISPPPAPPANITIPALGDVLTSFPLTDLAGIRWNIPDDFAGRPLLINVWASWCAPCIREMPELDRFARDQGKNGIQVFGIALDDLEAVQEFLRHTPVSYPVAVDTPGPADAGVRAGNRYGVLPYTALISTEGLLVRQKIGPFTQGETDTWTQISTQ